MGDIQVGVAQLWELSSGELSVVLEPPDRGDQVSNLQLLSIKQWQLCHLLFQFWPEEGIYW